MDEVVVPLEITRWLAVAFQRPQVDPEWLRDCYTWVLDKNPAAPLDMIMCDVEDQLLLSNLKDSMLVNTGLPRNVGRLKNARLGGPPILVQIMSIMEIGHSAFSLQNTQQARLEREDLAQLNDDADADNDEGAMRKYPRSMLRLELSDGHTTLQAIEYKRLPELELGVTKLGCKMFLKDVRIRGGFAFLEPDCVKMKGHHEDDLVEEQDAIFARALQERLGHSGDVAGEMPPPPPPASPRDNNALPTPAPTQRRIRAAASRTPPPSTQVPLMPIRSPLGEVSPPPPPAAESDGFSYDDDEGQPRRRKLPNRPQRSPSPDPPPRVRLGAPPDSRSRYFSNSNTGLRHENPSAELAREQLFSPHRQAPIDIADSDDEDGRKPPHGSLSHGAANARPDSRDDAQNFFDDDEFYDAAALENIDRIERENLLGTSTATTHRVLPSVASTSRSAVSARGSASTAQLDILDLDISDEEVEIDKENVPAPRRHIKRRTTRPPDVVENVIEISD